MNKWKREAKGLYIYRSPKANGEIFKSPEPLRRWAWAVYHEGGVSYSIVCTLASARWQADRIIAQAESL